MARRKRQPHKANRRTTTSRNSKGHPIPFNHDGLIPNGYTISFDDFDDEIQIEGSDDDAADDAPRGGYGSQVLPVALHLPQDFTGEPEDGDEYLFLVRREAAAHPGVKVAEAFLRKWSDNIDASSSVSTPSIGPSHRPLEAWRTAFLSRFTNMRETFSNIEKPESFSGLLPEHYLPIPAAADESSWKSYINGRKRKATNLGSDPETRSSGSQAGQEGADSGTPDSPDLERPNTLSSGENRREEALDAALDDKKPAKTSLVQQPKPPIPVLLHDLDQHAVISLIDHFNTWLQERLEAYEQQSTPSTVFLPPSMRRKPKTGATSVPEQASSVSSGSFASLPQTRPSPTVIFPPLDSQWLFSLLVILDPLLSSQDISILRDLSRTCQEIAQVTHEYLDRFNSRSSEEEKVATRQVIAGAWMVNAAVWEVWKQRDLWM